MKKARKGMFLSLLSLVFALAITATSTYAWFVVNKEVTASNMQVTVRSDTTYLVISNANTSSSGTADMLESLEATSAVASHTGTPDAVLPVMYDEEESGAGVIKWKIGSGQAYNNGAVTLDEHNNPIYTSISSTEVTNEVYFVKYTFYVGLTHTTALPASNLRVKSLKVEKVAEDTNATFMPAISAVVNCGDVWVDYENINSIAAEDYDGTHEVSGEQVRNYAVLSASVAKDTIYQVDVYVYVNGDNSVVKSANAANLGSFKVEMKLQVTPGVYGA